MSTVPRFNGSRLSKKDQFVDLDQCDDSHVVMLDITTPNVIELTHRGFNIPKHKPYFDLESLWCEGFLLRCTVQIYHVMTLKLLIGILAQRITPNKSCSMVPLTLILIPWLKR